jgi:serine/threonine-protein kinase
MNRPKYAFGVLVVLYGLLVALVIVTNPWLPERVATHFGSSGTPDGWMSRPACAAFTLETAALTAWICAGSTYLARFFSDSAINIPNRAYWLAPERRRETHDKLFSLGLWIACLTTALFLALHVLVVRANRADPVRLPAWEGLGLLLAFLTGIGGLIGFSATRSWRVPSEDEIERDEP